MLSATTPALSTKTTLDCQMSPCLNAKAESHALLMSQNLMVSA